MRQIAIYPLIVVMAALVSACLTDSPSSSQSPEELMSAGATQAALMAPPTATAFVIEYVISGDTATDAHAVNIRWSVEDANDEETHVNVAEGVWSRFFTVVPGSALILEAGNTLSGDDRIVRCEIYLSGRLWDSNESAGAGTPATCEATAGW